MSKSLAANPVIHLRQELGLNRVAMAIRLGISYDTLARVELGYLEQLPPKVLKAFASVGYDTVAIQGAYIQWRAGRHEGAATR